MVGSSGRSKLGALDEAAELLLRHRLMRAFLGQWFRQGFRTDAHALEVHDAKILFSLLPDLALLQLQFHLANLAATDEPCQCFGE